MIDLERTFHLRGPLIQVGGSRRHDRRVWLFTAVALGGVITAFLLRPLRQPEAYHHFADARTLLGVPNCLNVISNIAFLVVGVLGFRFLAAPGRFIESRERLPYGVFFGGVFLTCFGSAYYHWQPRDATLVWDRLPMALAFMSLLAATLAARISVPAGIRLLWPLVVFGAGTVWWWQWTGNLWPYMAAQYFSVALIGLLVVMFPARYTRGADIWAVMGWYLVAKGAEALDARIYKMCGWVSGHTIKHLAAAVAVYWVLRMLRKRTALGSLARMARSPRPLLPLF